MAKMTVNVTPAVVRVVVPEKKEFLLSLNQDEVNFLHVILGCRNIPMAGPYGEPVNHVLYNALDKHKTEDEKHRVFKDEEHKRFLILRDNNAF